MDGQFKIKSYGYGELAMLYFPNSTKKSASVQLRRWIKYNSQLNSELISNCFKKGQRLLTPLQVSLIVKYLGNP